MLKYEDKKVPDDEDIDINEIVKVTAHKMIEIVPI